MGMKLIVKASGKSMAELAAGSVKDPMIAVASLALAGFITYNEGEPMLTVTKAPSKPGEKRETFAIPLASIVGVTLPQLERFARDEDPLAGKRQKIAALLSEGMTAEDFAMLAKHFTAATVEKEDDQNNDQNPEPSPDNGNPPDTGTQYTGTETPAV